MGKAGLCVGPTVSTYRLIAFAVAAFMVCQLPSLRAQAGTSPDTKAKSKPAALPTLLVMCDLGCDWKLDGEIKGHINGGAGAKVKVESGQHMVEATTEDGVDQVKQPCTVKSTGQSMVNIEFWPIRYARLVTEQEEKDKAAQEAQAKTARESREKAEQEAREKAAREREAKIEAQRQPWTDPATGLMWTKKDTGDSISWQQAVNYCRNLRLGGYDDWRLPTIDELSGIKASEANVNGEYLKGEMFQSFPVWSSSAVPKMNRRNLDSAWTFEPSRYGPQILSINLECEGCQVSALCVRRISKP